MKTHVSVIQPVEPCLCRACRFALHVAGDVDELYALVWCTRRDCDNTGGERFAPHSVKWSAEPPAPSAGAWRTSVMTKDKPVPAGRDTAWRHPLQLLRRWLLR